VEASNHRRNHRGRCGFGPSVSTSLSAERSIGSGRFRLLSMVTADWISSLPERQRLFTASRSEKLPKPATGPSLGLLQQRRARSTRAPFSLELS